MSLISILIKSDNQYWDKQIKVCGTSIYHRRDTRTVNDDKKTVGFNVGQFCDGEILDD